MSISKGRGKKGNIKPYLLLILAAALMLSFGVSFVVEAQNEWEWFPEQEDVPLQTKWRIQFTREFSPDEIDGIVIEKDNVFIPVEIELLSEEKQAIVKPVEPYEPGERYNLRIFLNNLNRYKMAFTTATVSDPDEFKPLEIKDSGYIVNDRGYLYYAVIMHNPNEKLAVEFPTYRITARDDKDQVIGTRDHRLSIIYPKQDFAYGFQAFQLDQQPAKVDFMALEPRDRNITAVEMLENPIFIPLEVVGVNKIGDSIFGEVSNPNSYDLDRAVVTAIFRDAKGEIIGGHSTFIDKVPAGGKTPFEIRTYSAWLTDNYTVYANIW